MSSTKLGRCSLKARSPGQVKKKNTFFSYSRGHKLEVSIMNFAQNVCLDDF